MWSLLNILVSKLLVVDPTNRLGAEDIIKHKWLQRDKAIIRDIQQVIGLVKSQSVSGQRIQGKIEDGRTIKRKRDDTETDLHCAMGDKESELG